MKKILSLLCIITLLFSGCGKTPVEKPIDLYGTYNENDCIAEEVIEYYNDVELSYPQIKGLKNVYVQDNINKDIYQNVISLVDKHENISYTNYYTHANFSNVISITFTVGFEDEPYYERIFFNYNLTDGSTLKLEDLFMEGTDILDIVRSSFYETLFLFSEYSYETGTHSLSEEKLYKIVKNYMAMENKTFTFSPSAVFLHYEEYTATVNMVDMPEKIAIYSKHLTNKALYTGEYQGMKDIITCSDSGQYSIFEKIEYGFGEDNLWYDICYGDEYFPDDVPDNVKSAYLPFKEKAFEDIYSSIDTYRERAKANPDKFYILIMKPSVSLDRDGDFINGSWKYFYYDTATIYHHIQLFEMPLSLYEEVYKDELLNSYRYEYFAMRGGVWLDTENTHGATVTEDYSSEQYNYITGEKIIQED